MQSNGRWMNRLSLFVSRSLIAFFVLVPIVFLVMIFWPLWKAPWCSYETGAITPIPDTDWVIYAEDSFCGALDAGAEKIFARNTKSKEQHELLYFGSAPEKTKIRISEKNIFVTVPRHLILMHNPASFLDYDLRLEIEDQQGAGPKPMQ